MNTPRRCRVRSIRRELPFDGASSLSLGDLTTVARLAQRRISPRKLISRFFNFGVAALL
jgi:hypothetical protein